MQVLFLILNLLHYEKNKVLLEGQSGQLVNFNNKKTEKKATETCTA